MNVGVHDVILQRIESNDRLKLRERERDMALKKSDDVIELPSMIFPPSRGIINRAIRHPILWPRIHMIGVNEPLFLIYYPVLPFYRRRFYGGRFSAGVALSPHNSEQESISRDTEGENRR